MDDSMENERAARRARAARAVRETEYAAAKRGNFFVRNSARVKRWWREMNESDMSLCLFPSTSAVRRNARRLIAWVWFERMTLATIIANCVALALYKPLENEGSWNKGLDVAETVFTAIFTLELTVKVVANNFLFGPPDVDVYLRDGWRVLDFLIVVGGWISFGLTVSGRSGGGLTAVRGLRALRPLKSISSFSSMRVFVSTTFASMGMVLNVLFFVVIVIIVLGILGVQRFAGTLNGRCMHESTREFVAYDIDVACSVNSGGHTCGASQICVATSLTGFDNGHTTFDNILGASFIIYRVLTLRGWVDLMYQVIDGTGDRTMVIIYFLLAVMFGAVFISSFVLAAVATKYRQTAIVDAKMADGEMYEQITPPMSARNVKRVASRRPGEFSYGERISKDLLEFMRKDLAYQKPLRQLVEHHHFENAITVAIVANTILLAVQYRDMSEQVETILTSCHYAFLCLFCVELVLKVLANGILGYVRDRYNVFDATIVIAGLIEVAFGNSSFAVARAFRLLRVLRATRLIARNKNIRRLIDIALEGLSSIFSFCGLLFVFVFVFTVLGMQLFGGKPEFYNVRPNFNTFGDSFLTVFEILTGASWYKTALTAMETSHGASAALFFILWSFIGSFVLLNLVTAMLIETFERASHDKELQQQQLLERASEQERRGAQMKRQHYINATLSSSSAREASEVVAETVKKGSGDSDATFYTANEVRRHPDGQRIMSRMKLRKQRNFRREVVVVEEWLEKTGILDDDSDCSEGEQNSDVLDELEKNREVMTSQSAYDDGAPEAELTTRMVEETRSKVALYVANGVPIPTVDRQVRRAYRQWKIDSAVEQGGDDDEDVNIMDANALRDNYGEELTDTMTRDAMNARRKLQENALAELRRSLLERSADGGTKEALAWASQASAKGFVVKSAEARLMPKEQTAVIAQRRAEGKKTGHIGKFKGEAMSAEGAAAIADANLISLQVENAAVDDREKKNIKRHGQQVAVDMDDSSDLQPIESSDSPAGRGAVWRSLARKSSAGKKSISESLRELDKPKTGPITESVIEYTSDQDVNSQRSSGSPHNSRSYDSQTTGDTVHRSSTLMPIIEYTQMPPILEVDFSLPRIKEDLNAGKVRRASGLPVRDIVVDKSKMGKFAGRIAEEHWFQKSPANTDEECMQYPSLIIFKPRLPMRRLVFMLIKHKVFERLMLFIILLSCAQLAVSAPTVNPYSDLAKVMKSADVSFTLIFAFEAIIKIFAMGFAMHPGAYLRSYANCLDFIIVLVSIVVEVSANASKLQFMRTFRLVRVLRPLRLLNRMKSMQIAVATLVHISPELVNVLCLGLFQFIIFAILGSQLFAGKFDYCNDPTALGRETCVGTFIDANGAHITRQWLHPPLNFDNTLISILTLFVVVTRDGWIDIAFQGMDSTALDSQPSLNKNGWSAIYFLTFMVIVSFVWTSMIVALVCHHYKSADELSGSSMILSEEQREWSDILHMKKHEAELKVVDDSDAAGPRFFLRKSTFSLVTSPRFENFIIFCIIANTVTMASYHNDQPALYAELQRSANIFFSWIFLLELALKLCAFLPQRYFSEPWNVFDFIVVVASIPDLAGVDFVGTNVLRVVRLGRILRLFKQARGLRAVFNTLVSSFEGVSHIFFLIVMLMFVYAVLGMNIFGDYDTNYPRGRVENFRNFGSSLMVLLRVITRDNWKRVMLDTMKCDYDEGGVAANCSNIFVPTLYFTTFIFFGGYVLTGMIIACVLSKFTENAVNEGLLSTANVFVTVRRKLLLDMFATKLRIKLERAKAVKTGRFASKKK